MEQAVLMIDYLRITQKADGSFSHRGDKAIDMGGKDSNIDALKAPFTGTIKRIYKNGNAVWIQSDEKVLYADGTIDYMTVLTLHDNDISNLYVGKKIKQGDVYYNEGTSGNATGNHIHIAVGKGKFSGSGWYKNSYGVWCINNQINIYDALFLLKGTKIINDGGYKWKYTDTLRVEKNDKTHTVKKGDNLYNISLKYNVNLKELVELNNIKNPDLIYPGQILKIPGGKVVYFKKYIGSSNSIVDALKALDEETSYNYRKKIAGLNNISDYTGTSKQNNTMLSLLKAGKLIKSLN